MKQSVTKLPFNSFLGIEPSPDAAHLPSLPAAEKYLNHLGTVHASALLALAEASSGEYLLQHLRSSAGLFPVVRRLEAKFRKPARGAVSSTATADPEAPSQLTATLAGKGRALISVAVELHDETSTHVLTATVEWFIQRTGPGDAHE
jgi:acyl-coenzyme A thioesterase PaaI-like protein